MSHYNALQIFTMKTQLRNLYLCVSLLISFPVRNGDYSRLHCLQADRLDHHPERCGDLCLAIMTNIRPSINSIS